MKNRLATIAAAGLGLAFALACSGTSSSYDTAIFIGTTGGGTTVCPGAGSYGSGWPDGTRVTLLAINVDDAYAGSEYERRLPMSGRVSGDLHNNGECWYGGGFVADDGTDFYFYKASFKAE